MRRHVDGKSLEVGAPQLLPFVRASNRFGAAKLPWTMYCCLSAAAMLDLLGWLLCQVGRQFPDYQSTST